MSKGTIKKVAGPLVIAEGMRDANMFDVVRVSEQRLIGEIIEMHGDRGVRSRSMRRPPASAPASRWNPPACRMSVELGPGLIGSIYDGIQRPLEEITRDDRQQPRSAASKSPPWTGRRNGISCPSCKPGDAVVRRRRHRHRAGDRRSSRTRSWCPAGVVGTVKIDRRRAITPLTETVAVIETANGTERAADACMQQLAGAPRPPLSGKAVPRYAAGHRPARHRHPVPHRQGRRGRRARPLRLAARRWCSTSWPNGRTADIVVYIGCGERGNEMTDVLNEFPELKDPKTGQSPDGAHGADRQHLRYARRGPRGVHLHRHHHRRIFPRHGLLGGADGRLHLPLGGGPARDVRPSGGDARRGGLPRLPGQPPGAVLRAGRPRHHAWATRAARAPCRPSAPFPLRAAISPSRSRRRRCASSRCSGAWTPSLAYQRHFPGHQLADQLFPVCWTPSSKWFNENVAARLDRAARPD